jgi:hypothetical protein
MISEPRPPLDPGVYRGEVMTVGVRWQAIGAAGGLFPALDANTSSRLSGLLCRSGVAQRSLTP